MERVEESKYLGVHLDNRLGWRQNTVIVYKKGQTLAEVLQCLQHDVAYLLLVCCGEFNLICSPLLGEQHQSQRLKKLSKLMKKVGSDLWILKVSCKGGYFMRIHHGQL